MKRIVGFLLVALAFSARADESTAYTALRAVKPKITDPAAKLVEVRGSHGQPQPPEWLAVLSDPTAHSGVREFTAAGDLIVAERTPIRAGVAVADMPAIDFARLNLDSDGAFQIVEKQAVEQKIGFDWIDYTLRAAESNGAPLWDVAIYDSKGIKKAGIQISAENGAILSPLQRDPSAMFEETTASEESGGKKMGGLIGVVGNAAKEVGTKAKGVALKVKDTTLGVAGNVEETLTGDRTIDKKSGDEQ